MIMYSNFSKVLVNHLDTAKKVSNVLPLPSTTFGLEL